MQATKTLKEREKELQALLATREGKAQLEALADHYYASGGRSRRGDVALDADGIVTGQASGE